MSVTATNWVWKDQRTQGVRAAQLVVLLALADVADDDGQVVFLNRSKGEHFQVALAAKCRISVATFRRITTELRELELLDVWRESTTAPNQYSLTMSAHSERSDRALTPPGRERSDRSTVSGERDVLSHENPLAPSARGNVGHPHPALIASLGDRPLATQANRSCRRHSRQRSNCIDCWTVRPLSFRDIPWCGHCFEDNRTEPLDPDRPNGAVRRCPRCNPRGMPAQVLEAYASETPVR